MTNDRPFAPFIAPKEPLVCPRLYTEFPLAGQAVSATLSVTGLGLYRAFLNGARVGDAFLTPGFNDYHAYLRVQTYDVTALLEQNNTLSAVLGDGWYKGRFGFDGGDTDIWGSRYLLSARLEVIYTDGRKEVVETDASWRAVRSTVRETSIYDGEIQDDCREAGDPVPCVIVDAPYPMEADVAPPVRCMHTLRPTLYVSPNGEQILDFGQNIAGTVRFTSRMRRGQTCTLQFGEVLQDGRFYRDNLRTAKASFTYTSDGREKIVEPMFTFFGFRYARVDGLSKVDPHDFTALVLYSDMPTTIDAETDSALVDRLLKNALWGQRGNFLDVPTDCPQRDERLGWTGDAQAFCDTACYQMDAKAFYRKYLRDLAYEQERYYGGDIPMYAPSLCGKAGAGGPAWADAATVIPWTLYRHYGDTELLSEQYGMMRALTETRIADDARHGNAHVLSEGFAFGDWLALDGPDAQALSGGTDVSFIRTAYYLMSVRLTGQAARALGNDADAARYEALAGDIRSAMLDEFFTASGRLAVDTQTGYVLALYLGLWRDRETLISGYRERLRRDAYLLTCGFVGAPLLLPALLTNGLDEEAFRFLYNEDYPGWLYAVKLGATTVWERWNSLLPDGTVSGTGMNSLNHYAFGSVAGGFYSHIAGLKPETPGWKSAVIAPKLSYRLRRLRVRFRSPCGVYEVAYERKKGDVLALTVEVPEGCTALVYLPSHPEALTERVDAGVHTYRYRTVQSFSKPFSADSLLADLWASDGARELLKTELGGAAEALSALGYERLRSATEMLPFLQNADVGRLDAALRKIDITNT